MRYFLLILAVATIFNSGCGSAKDTVVPPKPRLTTANFDAIQNGMSLIQVMQIIGRYTEEVSEPAAPAGKPAASPSSVRHCRWKEASSQIDIMFDGDKVVSKSATGLVKPE
jgi:hypothetical protein